MSDTHVLTVERLTRLFGRHRAVNSVSFDVEPGTITAVLGPNGSGKTTLFRLLSGMLVPTDGSFRFQLPGSRVSPRIVSIIADHEPPMTFNVESILKLGAAASGTFDWEFARSALDVQKLSLRSYWASLSKGQKRWVLAINAIAGRPDVMLLDEPADGLDTASRRCLYEMLRQAALDHGATVLVASHILHDIERASDDVVILKDGRRRLAESLDDLRESVREVEFAEHVSESTLKATFHTVFKTDYEGSTTRAWVRTNGVQQDPAIPSECSRKPVGLEELFLAITGEPTVDAASQAELCEA